ncbi:MAG: transketolase [Proteobacteria bacterium]|nr:transketolase [Pseudomonadota bacterium]MBU1738205.1 transketolase [Pseudomonadota bacterium]
MRQAFLKTLIECLAVDPAILLLTSDTGFHVFDDFQREYPENYLNVGISEAAMIGIAAGLALAGRKVMTYAIAPFATFRCLEQIRVDLCCQKLPVMVVGVGAGLTYGPAGPTHHTIEDIAVMKALPNMTVFCPGDPWETEAAVRAGLALDGPCYLRLGKSSEPLVHQQPPAFRVGEGILLRPGTDLAILATGTMLAAAVEVADRLKGQGISAELISMPTVKPIDRRLIGEAVERFPLLVTMEEHSLLGGFGSAVADTMLESGLASTRLLKFGIPDVYCDVAGSQEYLRAKYGLDPESMTTRILEVVRSRS